jgi:FkbM family methyltransferase
MGEKTILKLVNLSKRIGLYNFLRNNYHKRIAYFSFHPKWDLKNKIVSINYKGKKLFFKLTNEKSKYYSRPIWKSEPLGFLKNELKGYLNECPEKYKKGIVLDIGSYQGALPIYLRKIKNNKKRIICFEPIRENYLVLEENLKLNKIDDAEIIKKGVWNKSEKVKFDSQGETSSISKEGKVLLEVTDLDSELKKLNISPKEISLIKMDIEGAEIEALEGMKGILKKGSPFLAIASYHWRDDKQTYKKVEEILKKAGYKVKTGYHKHLTTWAWKD